MYSNNPYYQPMPQPQGYQRPSYLPQQAYQPQQIYQQPAAQDNAPQVRFVANREEAVAATVIPGMPCLMINRAGGEIYFKAVDAQTGVPVFEDYARKQPEQTQAPQYATVDAVSAAMRELEQRFEQKLSALAAPRQASRKAVSTDD